HFLPDLVAVLRPPLLHEFLEDGINFLWQNDFEPHQLIAGGSRLSARNPLPLQPQGLARTGAGRDAHVDFTVDRRHRHLAAEHRFIKRDRQIDQYIPALAAEEGVRPDLDADIGIARGPAIQPRAALALQPDILPVADADGHGDVK